MNISDAARELKPCPFCGSRSDPRIASAFELNPEDDAASSLDMCAVCDVSEGGCGAASGYRRTFGEVVTAWNTRDNTATAALTLELERLRSEVYETPPNDEWGGVTWKEVAGFNATACRDNQELITKAEAERDQLRQQLAEVREDSKRLDWLGKLLAHPNYWEDIVLAWDHEDGVWLSKIQRGDYFGAMPMERTPRQPDLRSAIDAAMSPQPAH